MFSILCFTFWCPCGVVGSLRVHVSQSCESLRAHEWRCELVRDFETALYVADKWCCKPPALFSASLVKMWTLLFSNEYPLSLERPNYPSNCLELLTSQSELKKPFRLNVFKNHFSTCIYWVLYKYQAPKKEFSPNPPHPKYDYSYNKDLLQFGKNVHYKMRKWHYCNVVKLCCNQIAYSAKNMLSISSY